MKLKNKKTGEIVKVEFTSNWETDDGSELEIGVREPNTNNIYSYHSLAELNADWEDYEEPKEWYWFIEDNGVIQRSCHYEDLHPTLDKARKEIGNYFETKEEAEKAVEKLKAWKQLKENCNFRFNGLERDERGRLIGVKVKYDKAQVTFDTAKRCYEILNLLFGGEE